MVPVRVVKEVDLFLTRRVCCRMMRLRPSPETNEIVRFIVAVMARKYNIKIYAICVLSDHWHLVIHDAFGNEVDFKRDCHNFIARAVNSAHGDKGSLWDSRQTSKVRCVAPADTIDRIAYTMANPVKHGLVKEGSEWPGVRHAWPDPPMEIKRPPHFFRDIADDGTWPESVTLEMSRPLGFEDVPDNELVIRIREAIKAAEESFRAEHNSFVGRAEVKKRDRYSRATSEEPKRSRKRIIACADSARYKLEIAKERAFRAEHAESLAHWRAGDRDVVFPYGTYKMRVVHGVNVAPPPPPPTPPPPPPPT